jgi:hypothetical protein
VWLPSYSIGRSRSLQQDLSHSTGGLHGTDSPVTA